MTTFQITLDGNPQFIAQLVEEGARLGALRICEEIEMRIRVMAHTAPEKRVKEELEAYYGDKRMPYWKGKLLQTMRVEEMGNGGFRLHFGAPYASQLEEGISERQPVSGELKRWAKFHGVNLKWMTTGHAHPFIWPVLENVMESGRGAELVAEAIVDVLRMAKVSL